VFAAERQSIVIKEIPTQQNTIHLPFQGTVHSPAKGSLLGVHELAPDPPRTSQKLGVQVDIGKMEKTKHRIVTNDRLFL
jgi:hypothetical protein